MSLPKPPTFKSSRAPEPTPEQIETPQTDGTSTANSLDEAAHLDGFIMPDVEAFEDHTPDAPILIGEDGEPIEPDPDPVQIDKDAFFEVFCMAFDMPAMMIPGFEPFGVQEGERKKARAASDSFHRLLEIYYPSALTPNSETLALLFAAAPFIVGKVMVVKDLMRLQKMARIEAQRPSQPQPDSESKQPPAQPSELQEWKMPDQELAA